MNLVYLHHIINVFRIQDLTSCLYMLIASHIDTFKLDIYVSQLYFNVTNKVARYTVAIVQKFHNGKSNKFNE